MPAITRALSEDELAQLREIFDLVDDDRSGCITGDELGELMTMLGVPVDRQRLQEMIDEIDEDGNGEIDFDEFSVVISRRPNSGENRYTAAQLKAAFALFEMSPGLIDVRTISDEVYRLATLLGESSLTQAELEEQLAGVETDPDGLFSYARFVDVMMDDVE